MKINCPWKLSTKLVFFSDFSFKNSLKLGAFNYKKPVFGQSLIGAQNFLVQVQVFSTVFRYCLLNLPMSFLTMPCQILLQVEFLATLSTFFPNLLINTSLIFLFILLMYFLHVPAIFAFCFKDLPHCLHFYGPLLPP